MKERPDGHKTGGSLDKKKKGGRNYPLAQGHGETGFLITMYANRFNGWSNKEV